MIVNVPFGTTPGPILAFSRRTGAPGSRNGHKLEALDLRACVFDVDGDGGPRLSYVDIDRQDLRRIFSRMEQLFKHSPIWLTSAIGNSRVARPTVNGVAFTGNAANAEAAIYIGVGGDEGNPAVLFAPLDLAIVFEADNSPFTSIIQSVANAGVRPTDAFPGENLPAYN